jgi:hypothetical protein
VRGFEAGVSSTTVAKCATALCAILNTAVSEDELIIVNPCRTTAPAGHRPPRPVLTPAELYALVDLITDSWKGVVREVIPGADDGNRTRTVSLGS